MRPHPPDANQRKDRSLASYPRINATTNKDQPLVLCERTSGFVLVADRSLGERAAQTASEVRKKERATRTASTRPQSSTMTAARQVLQTRALQCSFSSVFHLRKAGMSAQEAKKVENLFITSVGLPLVAIGATGLGFAWFKK